MAFYADMAKMARDLLKPDTQGGLGQGVIALTRVTYEPGANPWEPVVPSTQTEFLRGAVSGVAKELIGKESGGTVIMGSDQMVIAATPTMGYMPGDVLSIYQSSGIEFEDESFWLGYSPPVIILSVQNIPAAGIVAAVRFIVRIG